MLQSVRTAGALDEMTVSLHAWSEAHIPQILAACEDWKELAQHGPPYWRPRSEAELRRKIVAMAGPQPATEYNYVLKEPDGRLVGECSLHAIDWRSRVAQIGICVWDPRHRGQGHGRAGIQYMIDWGVGHLGLQRLEAWIVEGNDASLTLFKQAGFTHEGTLRRRYLHAGIHRDVNMLGALATDFDART